MAKRIVKITTYEKHNFIIISTNYFSKLPSMLSLADTICYNRKNMFPIGSKVIFIAS
jgi:hypothetical protein